MDRASGMGMALRMAAGSGTMLVGSTVAVLELLTAYLTVAPSASLWALVSEVWASLWALVSQVPRWGGLK